MIVFLLSYQSVGSPSSINEEHSYYSVSSSEVIPNYPFIIVIVSNLVENWKKCQFEQIIVFFPL